MTPSWDARRICACLRSLAALAIGGALLAGCAGTNATTEMAPRDASSATDFKSVVLVPGGAAGSADGDTSSAAGTATTERAALLPEPSIEKLPLRYACVAYARVRSGLPIFGDAKTWWVRARNVYQEISRPIENSVMVFASSRRIRRGHVAVVTQLVSPREVRVDQANWENHGEIDHATPVMDVSPANDWSEVRVWNTAAARLGARVYKLKGFIANTLADAGTHPSVVAAAGN